MKLFEMAAKKECPHCGKSMAGNHWWKKGEGWKCSDKMGTKPRKKKEEAPAPEPKPDDRVSRDYKPKDANDEAAHKRAMTFRKHLERERGMKDSD